MYIYRYTWYLLAVEVALSEEEESRGEVELAPLLEEADVLLELQVLAAIHQELRKQEIHAVRPSTAQSRNVGCNSEL